MFAELAHFCVILSMVLGLFQIGLLALTPSASVLSASRRASYTQALTLLVALIGLGTAFVGNDFSLLYVAQHSSKELPIWYQITAIWGAHEGSVLLWATLLSLWAGLWTWCYRHQYDADHQLMQALLSGLQLGFVGFILFTSNPFLRLLPTAPTNGRDLNPLLQDPGFLIHPPMLYMGYVGTGVIYAAVLVSLIRGRINQQWLVNIRPWALAAWSFLTLGITLGSWWSYRVLGWGGYWAWDPVENASLLPWLVLTAFIHSMIVTIRRQAFYAWTLLLGILSFALSLLGTFLVRSGVLTSVHAFAVDPTRGIYILLFLFLVICSALALYAWQVRHFLRPLKYHALSRESAILANNYCLMSIMLTVLLGTLYPMIIDALGLGKLSVGAPYFNQVVIPLTLPLTIIMGIGPLSLWRQDNPKRLWSQLKLPVVISSLVILSVLSWKPALILGMSACGWIVITSLTKLLHKQQIAMGIAHLGLAVFIFGLTIHENSSQQAFVKMAVGERIQLPPYEISLSAIEPSKGPNYTSQQATFTVFKDGELSANIVSDKRLFVIQNYPMSHPGISTNLWRDIYIALGDEYSDGDWSVRVYVKPGIRMIWFGGILMVLGGLMAIRRRELAYAQ